MLSNTFYTVNFSISIVFSVIGLIFSLTTILLVLFHRQRHTVANILTCNTAFATISLLIINIVSVVYGFRENGSLDQPACVFRGYWYIMSCAAVCYSYLIQALNRLFCAVFYQYTNLQAWNFYWSMIVIKYIFAFLLPIVPIFLNGYVVERESRLCVPSTKVTLSAMYIIFSVYLIPLTLIGVIYCIILHYARQSSSRIVTFAARSTTVTSLSANYSPNFRRELILMRRMLILMGILICAGIPCVIVVFWHATKFRAPPECLHLLLMNSVTSFAAVKMIALFYMSREMKNTTVKFLRNL